SGGPGGPRGSRRARRTGGSGGAHRSSRTGGSHWPRGAGWAGWARNQKRRTAIVQVRASVRLSTVSLTCDHRRQTERQQHSDHKSEARHATPPHGWGRGFGFVLGGSSHATFYRQGDSTVKNVTGTTHARSFVFGAGRFTCYSLLNTNFAQLLIWFFVLLFSLTVHEMAHAWTADRLGDPTARRLGRVSLNPLVHADPIGTIVFPLVAAVTRVPLIGWAKPVP